MGTVNSRSPQSVSRSCAFPCCATSTEYTWRSPWTLPVKITRKQVQSGCQEGNDGTITQLREHGPFRLAASPPRPAWMNRVSIGDTPYVSGSDARDGRVIALDATCVAVEDEAVAECLGLAAVGFE
jgi:hypothetical protein